MKPLNTHRAHHATKARWARFWDEQPDLPVVLAFAISAPTESGGHTRSGSVVARHYREEYAKNGTKGKGNGDALYWYLHNEFSPDGELMLHPFEAFLDENKVNHRTWRRDGNGWQGRLRMSASVVLRNRLKRGETIYRNGEPLSL